MNSPIVAIVRSWLCGVDSWTVTAFSQVKVVNLDPAERTGYVDVAGTWTAWTG